MTHDQLVLAEAIKKHLTNALAHAAHLEPGDRVIEAANEYAKADCAEAIARTFARFAYVDSTEFLTACGVRP